MTVRAAKFADIPRLAEIMASAHQRSRYVDNCTFDEIEAKQLLVRCIQRHGQMNYMGSLVLVSERNDNVDGFIVGILDQVYPALSELKATDLLIVHEEGADPRDFPVMLDKLIAWGSENPKVVEILLGVTDAIIDWHRAKPIYERAGLEQCGGLFRIGFDRSSVQKAEGF